MSVRNFLAGFLLFSLGSVLTGAAQPLSSAAGSFDGPAELPRVHVKSALADTPAPGKVHTVRADDNLQQALNQAACGDTIKLEAGAVFTGHFIFPAKKCDDAHWIILRTSAPDSALPPEGSRLTPCYAGVASLPGRPAYPCSNAKNVLARIEYPKKGSGPFDFAPGANHYRMLGLEITRSASEDSVANLVSIAEESPADHLVFDRVWIHGTPQSETTRGIRFGGSTDVAVVDSYFTDFHCIALTGTCTDAQAVAGGLSSNPMGPYKIENNFLEASGEVVMFGGGGATSAPSDIEIRHNHLFRPMTWMKDSPGFVGSTDGHPFIVKNIFELKNGERVLFENNILENCWGGYSQEGYAILLTPKSQGHNQCPECRVLDVTIRNSKIMNVGAGFQIANAKSDFGALAKDGGRYSIHDVLLENVDGEQFRGHGTLFQISTAGLPLHDVSIDHVTGQASKSLFILGSPADSPKTANFTFTNNLIGADRMQFGSTGGGPKNCAFKPEAQGPVGLFESCFSNYKVAGNVIMGGGSKWPSKNELVKKQSDVGFMTAEKDRVTDYRLNPSSRYKKAGTDQKDVGADIDAIENAIRGAE
jgi:hypothetical protein